MSRIKYPRTRHLPWSPGVSADDLVVASTSPFDGREVVVTEKMDGENTTLYRDGLHARSIDSRHHPSRNWVKSLHGTMAHLIPDGWRLCGENLYALHSLPYEELPSYFMLFSVWDEHNHCLSWDETLEWAQLLGLCTVPVLCRGLYDERSLRERIVDTAKMEGYVVRLASGFDYREFDRCVAKWVRKGHVQSDEHWMHKAVVPNGLAQSNGEES